jgi:hypothetical protein
VAWPGYHGRSPPLASSGIRPWSSILACSCSRCAERVRKKVAANFAQAFDVLMSTMRIASIRGLRGPILNNRGGSPLSTQRQNFRSAVTMRCWSPMPLAL